MEAVSGTVFLRYAADDARVALDLTARYALGKCKTKKKGPSTPRILAESQPMAEW